MKQRKRLFKLQWSLQTMFLLTAVVAAWVPYFHLQQKIEQAKTNIDSMTNMARELIIEDSDKISVVKKMQMRWNDNRWEIYLPNGEYVMRLATQKIDNSGFAPVSGEAHIHGGRHLIELLQADSGDNHNIKVLIDNKPVIEIKESPDWNKGYGSSGGGNFANCSQLLPEEPLVLFRRRFLYEMKPGKATTPKTPSEGLLLWIEQVPEENDTGNKENRNNTTPTTPAPLAPPAQTP